MTFESCCHNFAVAIVFCFFVSDSFEVFLVCLAVAVLLSCIDTETIKTCVGFVCCLHGANLQ